MVTDDVVNRFAQAIARAEGFYETDPTKIPTVPQRARNPGDITDEGNIGLGVIQTSGPAGAAITIYATVEDGWAALQKKVRRMLDGQSEVYKPDLTIVEVGLKYSGNGGWGLNVAKQMGVDSRMTLAELASDNQETA